MRQIARSRWAALTGVAVVGALALSACSSSSTSSESSSAAAVATSAAAAASSAAPASAAPASSAAPAAAECTTPAPVKLQLQWVAQAQFAGYYAAKEKGYYKDQCLDVTILEGGVDIVPQTVLAQGGADFAISWVPKALASREQGANITDVAQVFQRSGTRQVSFVDKNIKTAADFKGKKIGNWGFGNEYELFAAITKAGLDPAADVELVQQQFDMQALLNGDIDAAEAMTYNEYAQVLEATNPATGELYKPEDLNVINWNDVRSAMLQDAIFARDAWLKEGNNHDVAVRFVRASLKGWIYCRDNPADCVKYTTDAGSQLGAGHQNWMMNEVNALIWPSTGGVGVLDPIAWNQTVQVAKGAGIIKQDPSTGAYDATIAAEALKGIEGDTKAESFTKGTVEVTPGGN